MTVPPATSAARVQHSILHELLYALSGIAGDVFVDVENEKQGLRAPNCCMFRVAPAATWLSDSDKQHAEKVLPLGYHVFELQKFVDAVLYGTGKHGGPLCWHGLAHGVEELCMVYQAAVLRVEQHISSNPTASLTSIQHYLSDFTAVLPAVHTILWELKTRSSLSDAIIMDHLHVCSKCGIPLLQAVLERLLWNCNQMLYKHLSAWMVDGVLLRTGFEFFVGSSEDGSVYDDAPISLPTLATQDAKSGREYSLWNSFKLHLAHVPKYIPAACPPKILDIGRAVRLLREQSPMAARASPQRDGAEQDDAGRGGELTAEQLARWSHTLSGLAQAHSFSGVAFERAVNQIHDEVGVMLRKLIVDAADLPLHLTSIKDLLLLGRNDLYRLFLLEASDMLRLPPRPATATADAQRAFSIAAAKTGVDESVPGFSHACLTWETEPSQLRLPHGSALAHLPGFLSEGGAAGEPSWGTLRLTYDAPGPLTLLLTRDSMALFEALWTYLFAVERARVALDEVWLHLMTQSRGRRAHLRSSHPQQRAVALLHQRMLHFVATLQSYFKEDVIEDAFGKALAAVRESRSFFEVREMHEALLARLRHGTFILTPSVCEKVHGVLQACGLLCRVVTEGAEISLDSVDTKFSADCDIFMNLLRSHHLQGAVRGSERLQLLVLKLNYNNFALSQ